MRHYKLCEYYSPSDSGPPAGLTVYTDDYTASVAGQDTYSVVIPTLHAGDVVVMDLTHVHGIVVTPPAGSTLRASQAYNNATGGYLKRYTYVSPGETNKTLQVSFDQNAYSCMRAVRIGGGVYVQTEKNYGQTSVVGDNFNPPTLAGVLDGSVHIMTGAGGLDFSGVLNGATSGWTYFDVVNNPNPGSQWSNVAVAFKTGLAAGSSPAGTLRAGSSQPWAGISTEVRVA